VGLQDYIFSLISTLSLTAKSCEVGFSESGFSGPPFPTSPFLASTMR
jgi:hypothetical protein